MSREKFEKRMAELGVKNDPKILEGLTGQPSVRLIGNIVKLRSDLRKRDKD